MYIESKFLVYLNSFSDIAYEHVIYKFKNVFI